MTVDARIMTWHASGRFASELFSSQCSSGFCHALEIFLRKVCPVSLSDHSYTSTTPQLNEAAVTKRSKWGSAMRIGLIGATLCLCLVGISHAQSAKAAIRKDLNVPAEELGSALQTVAKHYDFQVLYRTEIVKDLRTQGAVGSLTSDEALGKVLKGTGLTYKYLDSNTVTIMLLPSGAAAAAADQAPSDSSNGGGKNSSQDFRVAQVDQNAAGPQAVIKPYSGKEEGISEIIITAQKREERLQDVPVPVTVITAQSLSDANEYRLQDYYSSVPGLNLSTDNRGAPSVSIRGITTGAYVTPTVGVTIDDVSFGSTVVASAYSPAPDIDPNEISRVEVLRGPQGTLYGASSIGGLIKYVTVDPSFDAVSGRVELGGDAIHNGNGNGYSASGAINVPLSDTLAIRANGFIHQDPGYIDNIETGQNGVNKAQVYGGRVAALWQPSEQFTMKLSALLQQSKSDGSSQVEIKRGFADLQQSYLAGTGGYDRKTQAFSANLTGKIGTAELTSITGYGHSNVSDSFDVSSLLGGLTKLLYGVGGDAWVEDNVTQKFSQELRLAMPLSSRVDWLFGLYYTHEHTTPIGGFVLVDPVTFQQVSQAELQRIDQTYSEYAAFTDFTIKITDQFDVQLGGREGHNSQTYNITTTGPLVSIFFPGQTSPVIAPEADSHDNSFTYLVTPRFKFSPDFMVYARLASGYRPGGPNDTQDASIPRSFAPDKTQNYELGSKADFLDRRLSLDASLYYIRWQNIQLSLSDPATGIGYTGNGSRAKSDGIELSVTAKPLIGMMVSSWVVWNNAELTQALPPGFPGIAAVGASGDRLPYSSRFSGNVSVDQEYPLWHGANGFVGGTMSYVGDREGEFATAPQRQTYPGFAKTDLRAGIKYDSWTARLFATNLADRRGILAGGLGTAYPYAFNLIQPRTIGFNVTRNF
jgi:iron complex outermembrane recepter protein